MQSSPMLDMFLQTLEPHKYYEDSEEAADKEEEDESGESTKSKEKLESSSDTDATEGSDLPPIVKCATKSDEVIEKLSSVEKEP